MSDDPRLGATLAGKYQIVALLGRGAFGAVYEAMNLELEKRVAVKLIDPELARHEEVVGRFRIEARAASRIESEHIVQVFDVGSDPAHGLYMVMELLRGEDLATRLDREFKLSPAVAVHIAAQAARGLAKAHGAGVVHRDLKPANLFLVTREDGSLLVKVVDFGISKLLGREPNSGLTRVGTTVGTTNYMSPEQARGLEVDGRTDVWALGAVLYEMLAGAPAYPHDLSYEQTIIEIATGPEPRLAQLAPWVPPGLCEVVDRALTRDLAARIPDCATFAALLGEEMPQATRPRREESLYMEASEIAPAAAPVADPESIEVIAPRRAPTTVRALRAAPAPTRRRWPWVIVPMLLVGGGFAAFRGGLLVDFFPRQVEEPAVVASVTSSGSASSTVLSAPKATSSHPRPAAHPKPKPSVKASPSHS